MRTWNVTGLYKAQKELTHAQIKALAGDPLILAASDEQAILEEWRKRDRVYKAAMRWYQAQAYRDRTLANADLLKACAAAKGKK